MTDTGVVRRWAPRAFDILTVAWVLALLALGWKLCWVFVENFSLYTTTEADRTAPEQGNRALAGVLLTLLAVAAGGPVLIATAAFARMRRTGPVFIALAVLVTVLSTPLWLWAWDTLLPEPEPEPAPRHTACQEHSGGDTRRPGG